MVNGDLRREVEQMLATRLGAGLVLLALVAGIVASSYFAVVEGDEAKAARKAEGEAKAAEARAEANAAREAEGVAKTARAEAERDSKEAKRQARLTNDARHAIQIGLALRARDEKDYGRVAELLREMQPEYQTAWETGYLRTLLLREDRLRAALTGHPHAVEFVAFKSRRQASPHRELRPDGADLGRRDGRGEGRPQGTHGLGCMCGVEPRRQPHPDRKLRRHGTGLARRDGAGEVIIRGSEVPVRGPDAAGDRSDWPPSTRSLPHPAARLRPRTRQHVGQVRAGWTRGQRGQGVRQVTPRIEAASLRRESDAEDSRGLQSAAPAKVQPVAASNTKLKRVGSLAPNVNAYAERWVQTLRTECLGHFLVLGESHLRHIVKEFVEHYNFERPHQTRGNAPLPVAGDNDTGPQPIPKLPTGTLQCREQLGGSSSITIAPRPGPTHHL